MGFLTIRQARLENWTIQKVSAEISIAQFTIEVSFDAIWQIHYLAYIICDESSWKQRKILIETLTLRDILRHWAPCFSVSRSPTMDYYYHHGFQINIRKFSKTSFITVGQLAWYDLCANFLCREFSLVLFTYHFRFNRRKNRSALRTCVGVALCGRSVANNTRVNAEKPAEKLKRKRRINLKNLKQASPNRCSKLL